MTSLNREYDREGVTELPDDLYDTITEGKEPRADWVGFLAQSPSMDNVYTFSELYSKFSNKVLRGYLLVTPKVDGVAVVLTKYSQGITLLRRGVGDLPTDISHILPMLDVHPAIIRLPQEVHGELFIGNSNFEKLNKLRVEKGLSPYKTQRAAVAGLASSLTVEDYWKGLVSVYYYAGFSKVGGVVLRNQHEQFDVINVAGVVMEAEHQDPLSFLSKQRELFQKFMPIDGLVVQPFEVDVTVHEPENYYHSRYAFKQKPSGEYTTLLGITWQVSRYGFLTPVAILEPIDIGGTTVSRANLFNLDYIKAKGAVPGSLVAVRKAGEVIPEVVSVKDGHKHKVALELPSMCPSCHGFVSEDLGKLQCKNNYCKDMLSEYFNYCLGINVLNIKGVGPSVVKGILERTNCRSMGDLIDLSPEVFRDIWGINEFTKNFFNELQGHRNIRLAKFLLLCNIPGVGVNTAEVLANNFETMHEIMQATITKLKKLPGFDSLSAHTLWQNLRMEGNAALVAANLREFWVDNPKKLETINVMISGAMIGGGRKQIAEELLKIGVKVQSKRTDARILFVRNPDAPSAKVRYAQAHDIPVIVVTSLQGIINYCNQRLR